MKKFSRHQEETVLIAASPQEIFNYANNHQNFSAHMNQSSWMMGGGSMNTYADEKKFQEAGSHLQMKGTVFGIKLFLDEVVTQYEPTFRKEWRTVGELNLLVIDHYQLGFKINRVNDSTQLKVYIDYDLPNSIKTRWLGILFGKMYANWCVKQLIQGVQKHFKSQSSFLK